MKPSKKKKLEAAGWKVGDAADFLELSREEVALVDMKLSLAKSLRDRRESKGITQIALAKTLNSSQSRVAKVERADASVSIDLLMRALLALGATRTELAKAIGRRKSSRAA